MQYPLSTSLCKALVFTKQSNTMIPKTNGLSASPVNSPPKTTVSLSLARTLITAFIKHHLYLFEVTKEEVDKEMHIKRVVHMLINQRTEECLAAQQQKMMMMMGVPETPTQNSSSSYPTNISKPLVPPQMAKMSSSNSGVGSGPPLTVIDTKQVSSLIIAIKVNFDGGVLGGKAGESKGSKVVNVHLNKEMTAADVLEMVLEKV